MWGGGDEGGPGNGLWGQQDRPRPLRPGRALPEPTGTGHVPRTRPWFCAGPRPRRSPALLDQLGGGGQLAGVGISTIGIPLEDGVELAPAIPGWERGALARWAVEAFGVPVGVATDVKAAATAEVRWGALAGPAPAIYLNLGDGPGRRHRRGGQVVAGGHGASGEIGYNLVGPADVGVGPGHHPVLEDTVSGMGLAARGFAHLGRRVTAEEVFRGAPSDAHLGALTTALIGELCLHLVNLTIAVDPARIAVGGGMVKIRGAPAPAARSGAPSRGAVPARTGAGYPPLRCPLLGALALGAEAAGARLAGAACLSAT